MTPIESAHAPSGLEACAGRFADLALDNIRREYPHRLDLTLLDASGLNTPAAWHPVFYGSYDWHSCVHMHWLLARLLRLMPALPQVAGIRQAFDLHFTTQHVVAEVAFLARPENLTFERTYGWAWLLKLQAELDLAADTRTDAARWRDALRPLADVICQRYLAYLPLAEYPIRAGTHANSAFGLLFALDYAQRTNHLALRKAITAQANRWFGRDRRYPAAYEPSGEDFLSAGLMEAVLMRRVVDGCDYADWWQQFCPPEQELHAWLTPVAVTDRSDARLAHLDGLNLSRAWCWRMLADALPAHWQAPVATSIQSHLEASLPHATMGHYAGTHWLASFALLALTQEECIQQGEQE